MSEFSIDKIFDGAKVIGVIADPNEGKSNLLYYLLKKLSELTVMPSIYYFGFRKKLGFGQEINSIHELEGIKNSVIFVDEFIDLFDLDDRKKKVGIERTLRLIYHNNNILILSGLPENFRKFISSKLNLTIYKKVTFEDFVNGSKSKAIVMRFSGSIRGNSVLNLDKNEALIYTGKRYIKIEIPYLEDFDTKKDNIEIVNIQ